jgi:hypothetical protein
VSAAVIPRIHASLQQQSRPSSNVEALEPLGGAAFYRSRTQALLRRYMRASMEMGRTPSLLGSTVFRGRASSYRLRTFEDCIIFLFDVEKCLKRLDEESKSLIARIALQEYTLEETARLTQQSERNVRRKYALALDTLTAILLDYRLLNPEEF